MGAKIIDLTSNTVEGAEKPVKNIDFNLVYNVDFPAFFFQATILVE